MANNAVVIGMILFTVHAGKFQSLVRLTDAVWGSIHLALLVRQNVSPVDDHGVILPVSVSLVIVTYRLILHHSPVF